MHTLLPGAVAAHLPSIRCRLYLQIVQIVSHIFHVAIFDSCRLPPATATELEPESIEDIEKWNTYGAFIGNGTGDSDHKGTCPATGIPPICNFSFDLGDGGGPHVTSSSTSLRPEDIVRAEA